MNQHDNSHPRLEAFYNTVPCGLITYQPDGKIVHANQSLLTWLDLSLEEALSGTFMDLLDKGGKFYYQLFVEPALKMHKQALEIDLTIQARSKSFSSLFSAVIVTGRDGSENVHATIYKVAHRKKYESELLHRKLQAEAEKKVKTEALNEVAFDQAHLVRAPLANVLGLIDLIQQMEMNEELSEMISLLRKSSEDLDDQVKIIVKKANL